MWSTLFLVLLSFYKTRMFPSESTTDKVDPYLTEVTSNNLLWMRWFEVHTYKHLFAGGQVEKMVSNELYPCCVLFYMIVNKLSQLDHDGSIRIVPSFWKIKMNSLVSRFNMEFSCDNIKEKMISNDNSVVEQKSNKSAKSLVCFSGLKLVFYMCKMPFYNKTQIF